jgi:nucleotide-binding universal stress UspA family protein
MFFKNPINRIVLLFSALLISAVLASACSGQTAQGEATESSEMEMENGMEHDSENADEHAEEHEAMERIPNEGALIRIVSPEEGSSFTSGKDILVEVEIENFELNVDGSHWHVYVDGTSYGMVVGDTTRQVLRNLEPGEHEITAYLALGTHEELEDGGRIHVTVTE